MNVFQKMAAIQAEMPVVAKNLEVQATKNQSYKAVSERDVLDAVKKLEEKYRVYSYPASRSIIESKALTEQTQYGAKTKFMLRIQVSYRFMNIDDPDDYLDVVSYGDGIDSGDKGTGKAMTYADKYALMKAYKISTGDDPDAEPSGEYTQQEQLPMDAAAFSVGFTELRNNLSKAGINIHDQQWASYIQQQANANTLDPGKLLMDLKAGQRVLAVMDRILKTGR